MPGSLVDVARASATGPDGGPPAVLLVAPVPLGAPHDRVRAVGLRGSAGDVRAARRRYYREVAAQTGAAFLDAGALVAIDPADGVHLDAAAHGVLGARSRRPSTGCFGNLLRGPLAAPR